MSAEIPDLWSEDVGSIVPRSPVAIIRAQATNLNKRTQGLVTGNVRSFQVGEDEESDGGLPYVFELRVPSIGDYSMPLFYFTMRMNSLYPVTLAAEWIKDSSSHQLRFEVEDEQALVGALRKILGDKSTVNTIGALMAHTGANARPLPERTPDDVPF